MSNVPIADYALLSDGRSAALVNRAGFVDWLCFPRFDGPSVFARLLDEQAGHWSIYAVGATEVSRRYLEGTMALETTFRTPTGSAVLVEAMAMGRNERGHELGVDSPGVLLRSVSCQSGTVEIELEYAPLFEYGLIFPLLRSIEGGIIARGGADVLVLSSPVILPIEGSIARARFILHAGEQASFALQHRASWEKTPEVYTQAAITDYLHDTEVGWHTWSDLHQRYEGPWRDLVHHSGRVLQALMYRPTGAIVAAPTTSLPESVGGERNWDYRYTWIRDASFTLYSLLTLGFTQGAEAFMGWLDARCHELHDNGTLQPMYGITGEHNLTEITLDHLEGYRQSRPVRIGNGAYTQKQLDIYGEMMDAI